MRRFGDGETDRPRNVHDLERIASVLAGAGLVLYSLKRLSLRRVPAALAGAALLHRGATGYCHTYGALGINTASKGQGDVEPIEVAQSITIGRSPGELYALWRRPDTLSSVMEGFAEVSPVGEGEMQWTVKLPLEQSVSYVTRTTEEREPELLRWQSGEGVLPRMEGALELAPAPGDWGTQVTLRMTLEAPGGNLGRALAKLLGPVPKLFAQRALRRFKSLAETGEIATLRNNPAARKDGRDR